MASASLASYLSSSSSVRVGSSLLKKAVGSLPGGDFALRVSLSHVKCFVELCWGARRVVGQVSWHTKGGHMSDLGFGDGHRWRWQ